MQRHLPQGLTNSSPGGTEEPLQAAPGASGSCQAHQLRGSLASWTLAGVPSLSAFAGLGSCLVGHPPPRTWPDVQGQGRSVCSLGLRGAGQAAGLGGAWRALARAPGRSPGVSLQTQGAFLPTRLHPKQPPGLVDSARLKPRLPGGPNLCFTLRHLEMAGRCCREEPGLQPRLCEAPCFWGRGSMCGLGALVGRGGAWKQGERGRPQPAPLKEAPRDSCTEAAWAGSGAPLLQPRSSLPWAMW